MERGSEGTVQTGTGRLFCVLWSMIELFICRKRKSPEADVRPRIVRMTWDVDAESTSAIMKDMGVSLLTSERATDKHWTAVSSHSAPESLRPHVSYLSY